MGCLRRERPPTRAIPDIRLLDGLDDHLQQLKDLKNRIWRAISRALGAKNIRSLARTVNSWFNKRIHGRRRVQRHPDAGTAAPVPGRAPDVSPEPVADPPADLGPELPPYANLDKLTDAVLASTGMFALFDEHDKQEEVNSNSKGKGKEDINEVIIVTPDKRQSYIIFMKSEKNLISNFFMLNPTDYEISNAHKTKKSWGKILLEGFQRFYLSC